MIVTNNIVSEAPNHFIEDGVLYKGPITRRIIRPDDNGFYNLSYQDKMVMLHEGYVFNKKNITKARIDGMKNSIPSKRMPEVGEMCDEIGVNRRSYSSFLSSMGIKSDQLTLDQHRDKMIGYKESSDLRKHRIKYSTLCKEAGVGLDAYRYFLKSNNFVIQEMTIAAHEIAIQKYIDKRDKDKLNNASRLCLNANVDYGKYKSWLYNAKGLNVSELNRGAFKIYQYLQDY